METNQIKDALYLATLRALNRPEEGGKASMTAGDLIQWNTSAVPAVRLGILLDDPIFPRWGNFPKQYHVLTANGTDEWITERHGDDFRRGTEQPNRRRNNG